MLHRFYMNFYFSRIYRPVQLELRLQKCNLHYNDILRQLMKCTHRSRRGGVSFSCLYTSRIAKPQTTHDPDSLETALPTANATVAVAFVFLQVHTWCAEGESEIGEENVLDMAKRAWSRYVLWMWSRLVRLINCVIKVVVLMYFSTCQFQVNWHREIYL